MEVIHEERYRGVLIRARAEHWAVRERPTKRALGILKLNLISEIEWNGRIATDKNEIGSALREYYKELFDLKPVDLVGFKRNFIDVLPRLDDETKEWLERPISVEEAKDAIDNLNPGKSSVPDGLSPAFYKMFKHEMSLVLARIYNEACNIKALPPSYAASHTVLIPKTDETEKLRNVKCYRPLYLTNADYKIFVKVLANKLQTVIHRIVGPRQTCGIRGRSIFTNIHTARRVLEYAVTMQTEVAVIQLDLEKAFDCVPREILFSVIERTAGLPPQPHIVLYIY